MRDEVEQTWILSRLCPSACCQTEGNSCRMPSAKGRMPSASRSMIALKTWNTCRTQTACQLTPSRLPSTPRSHWVHVTPVAVCPTLWNHAICWPIAAEQVQQTPKTPLPEIPNPLLEPSCWTPAEQPFTISACPCTRAAWSHLLPPCRAIYITQHIFTHANVSCVRIYVFSFK